MGPFMLAQDGGPAPGMPGMDVPMGPLLGMISGLVVLGLLLWGIKQPLAWVVIAFLAIGGGVGCLAYGISQAVMLEEPRLSQDVTEASACIGGGAGGTVGGIVLLVVALVRCRRRPEANR